MKLTASDSFLGDVLRDQGIGPEHLSVSELRLMLSRRALVALMRINASAESKSSGPLSPPQRTAWWITKASLCSLALDSRLPEAQRLNRWLKHEVLPSIQTTGSYDTTKISVRGAAQLAPIALQLIEYTHELRGALAEAGPKVEGFDRLIDDHDGRHRCECTELPSDSSRDPVTRASEPGGDEPRPLVGAVCARTAEAPRRSRPGRELPGLEICSASQPTHEQQAATKTTSSSANRPYPNQPNER